MTILIRLAVCAGWSELLICNIHKEYFHWTQIIMSTTICTDPGVSYRNHLDTCIYVWEPMENTAHGYVISRGSSWLLTWRKQRKRSVTHDMLPTGISTSIPQAEYLLPEYAYGHIFSWYASNWYKYIDPPSRVFAAWVCLRAHFLMTCLQLKTF